MYVESSSFVLTRQCYSFNSMMIVLCCSGLVSERRTEESMKLFEQLKEKGTETSIVVLFCFVLFCLQRVMEFPIVI